MEQMHYKLALRFNSKEPPSDSYMAITEKSLQILGSSPLPFSFLFKNSSDDLFEFIHPSLESVFKGTNLNIISYSEILHDFSFFTPPDTLSQVFSSIFASEYREKFTYSCSFLQIVNENLIDLLQSPNRPQKLGIKRDLNDSIFIENLSEYVVEQQSDLEFLIAKALNSSLLLESDEKVLMLQFFFESRKANSKGLFIKSKLNFIDLSCSGHSFKSFKKCLSCLVNGSSVPYKESKFTQILSDSLIKSAQNLIIATISPFSKDSEVTLQTLNTLKNFESTQIVLLNSISNNHPDSDFLLDLSKIKAKQSCEDVWKVKEKTDLLKSQLKKKTTVEEVENLITENKALRIKLQSLIGEPLAENDLEHPESFQDALVLTEDLIKKRKLDIASAEMKQKLEKDNRCLICTLKHPCKHTNKDSLVVYKPKTEVLQLGYEESNTFLTGTEADGPKKFRIRSSKGKLEIHEKNHEDRTEKIIREAQKKLKVLNKIEVYKEEKLRKEIEKIENEAKAEKEEIEKEKLEIEKKKKYFDAQKEKLYEHSLKKREEEEGIKRKKERPASQNPRKRLTQGIKIKDYENRRFQVFEILKQQSKLLRSLKSHRPKSTKKINDSLDLLDIEDY